jgi:hypothetical protein
MHSSEFFESKYLRGADLIGKEVTATIKHVIANEFTSDDGRKVRKPVIEFTNGTKALVLNRTNIAGLSAMYGDDMDRWAGKKVTLHPDRVPYRGRIVDTIRVARPKAPAEAPDDSIPF